MITGIEELLCAAWLVVATPLVSIAEDDAVTEEAPTAAACELDLLDTARVAEDEAGTDASVRTLEVGVVAEDASLDDTAATEELFDVAAAVEETLTFKAATEADETLGVLVATAAAAELLAVGQKTAGV